MKYLLSILAFTTLVSAVDTKQELCERITICYIEVAEKNQEKPSKLTALKTKDCAKARAAASCNYTPVRNYNN